MVFWVFQANWGRKVDVAVDSEVGAPPVKGGSVTPIEKDCQSSGCWGFRDAPGSTPWLVPVSQPLDLAFFQKVFGRLRETNGTLGKHDKLGFVQGVPLLSFQRAMARLFLVLHEDRKVDAKSYDSNKDGTVGWWEFCNFWKDEKISVQFSTAERIYITLEDPQSSRAGRIASIIVLTAILISAGSFILSTLPSMQEKRCPLCVPEPFKAFDLIDTICVILFTIEYLLRLGTSAFMRLELINPDQIIESMCTDETIRRQTKLERVWSFVRAWANLIDLAAILPSYIAWFMPKDEKEGSGDANMTFKLIRLMRVVRAFRLGRRFESVIIIARAMHRSMRALWVLVLNICLGMLIFGAVMFFVEQGEYDPVEKTYVRDVGYGLNDEGTRFVTQKARTPFESIPHSFWWAIVTCTTVGYGDIYPTTVGGKITAGITMIWSLCVIALPVGVIGANFTEVWAEYDSEQKTERNLKKNECKMAKETLGCIDPLTHTKYMHIDVYHDSGMSTKENDIFIGEADVVLEIEPHAFEQVHHQLRLSLRENRAKSDRKVSGSLYLEYTWSPRDCLEAGVILDGTLMIKILYAEKLVRVDWNEPGYAHPYVVLTVFSRSPSKSGELTPDSHRTSTVENSLVPTWNETRSFQFHWHKAGIIAKQEADRLTFLCSGPETLQTNSVMTQDEEAHLLMNVLPQVRNDIGDLRTTAAKLQAEMQLIRKGTAAILAELGVCQTESACEVDTGMLPTVDENADLPCAKVLMGEGAGEDWNLERQVSPREDASVSLEDQLSPQPRNSDATQDAAESEFRFVVPGVVPEETPRTGSTSLDKQATCSSVNVRIDSPSPVP